MDTYHLLLGENDFLPLFPINTLVFCSGEISTSSILSGALFWVPKSLSSEEAPSIFGCIPFTFRERDYLTHGPPGCLSQEYTTKLYRVFSTAEELSKAPRWGRDAHISATSHRASRWWRPWWSRRRPGHARLRRPTTPCLLSELPAGRRAGLAPWAVGTLQRSTECRWDVCFIQKAGLPESVHQAHMCVMYVPHADTKQRACE